MDADTADLDRRVRERLDEVLDPCSTFTERPQSITDLGLVERVTVDGGDVTVHLLPTNQLCTYIPHMTEEIEDRVRSLPAVDSVAVEVVADEVWTRERMTEAARREREAYFRERINSHGITPSYDGESWSDEIRRGPTRGTDD